MPPFETRSSQFGLVSGIRQPASDMVLMAEPTGLFTPEARKGQLYIVAEAEGDVARGRDACQLALKTIRRLFYEDSSYSVTSSLRKAIGATNKALYEHNFSVAAPKRAVVGVTCAVLKGEDLYVAQILPTQAYVFSTGKLRALPQNVAWNSGAGAPAPFLKPSALGASLSVEPEFYRATLRPGDTLVICTSNLTRLLGQEDMLRRLRSPDPSNIVDELAALCQGNGLPEAHGLVVAAAPPLSPAAQVAPMSRAGISERSRMTMRRAGAWASRMTGDAALLFRGQARAKARRMESRIAQEQRQQEQMTQLPPEPPPPPRSIPPAPPLDLGESLAERMEAERKERRSRLGAPPVRDVEEEVVPPSAFLGEETYKSALPVERRIDLSDTPGMAMLGRASRPSEMPPLEPTLGERISVPLSRLAGAVSSAGHRRRLRRPPPNAVRQGRRGQGLTYRRQGPPFPWHLLVILVLVVSAAILYGLNLSREIAQRQANDTLARAATAVAAVSNAPDEASAQGLLDAALIALTNVQSTGAITSTAENRQQYEELQREYERSLASLQKLTYFDDLTEIARHPTPGGVFGSIVVPPPSQGITATASFESIYVLDKIRGVLYSMPRAGGSLEPLLRPEQTIGPVVVGNIKDIDWREDTIIAVAQSGDTGPFVFFYRNGNDWGYNTLAGSETWVRAGDHFRAANYGGNLYVWDGGVAPEQANQIQKYLSGNYGLFPDPWIKDSGGQKVDNVVDLAIDGNVYLLRSDGHILVFKAGVFLREIVPQGVNPPLSALVDFFVTGDPDNGSIFLVDLNQRIIEIDKQTGAVLQQVRARPGDKFSLDQLTNIYVDTSSVRPVLYLVNGEQVLRGTLPPRPRPFRATTGTPGATPATTAAPAPTAAP